ncbi:inactive protein RESTRICTED TEV MOVEMENT 2-like isoform X2 [Carya illinoinensis]|uniref:inactive protein RESTRICTED TEV MOVEMENT 2-like isoform X2 n=1 Tax=Carya illinoinensis TaxID=32201 RepID=UPI001C719A5B|nr:inactive protein RESTRICTED TEV MOVEMENT 2-like isoform X2 [Carya illinoinensis]
MENPVVEEFVPSSGWTEDSSTRCLLVDLPGFQMNEVQLQITGSGKLMISGERKVNEDKIVFFEQTYTVPKNTDLDNTTGKFSDEILYVTVPKQVVEEKRTDENVEENGTDENVEGNASGSQREDEKKSKGNANVGFSEETTKDLKNKSVTCLENVVEMFKRNKGILMTAILSFSLGVLVTRKSESTGY